MSKGWTEWGYPETNPHISVAVEYTDDLDLHHWDCGLCDEEGCGSDGGEREDEIKAHLAGEEHQKRLTWCAKWVPNGVRDYYGWCELPKGHEGDDVGHVERWQAKVTPVRKEWER